MDIIRIPIMIEATLMEIVVISIVAPLKSLKLKIMLIMENKITIV
jgi:hypothetical protein